MSRTDKTDPYWVRLNSYGFEVHDHRSGVCTMADFDPTDAPYGWRHRTCGLGLGVNEMGQAFYTRRITYAANRQERAARARLRAQLTELRKAADYDDVDVPPFRHRHNALWEW